MPNHFHGIIGIDENSHSFITGKKVNLGNLISAFKKVSLKKVKTYIGDGSTIKKNNVNDNLTKENNVGKGADSTEHILNQYGTFWQKSFYDHIIRNEADLYRMQEYILNNPINWEIDSLNPKNLKTY